MKLPLAQLSFLSDLNVTPPSHVPSSDSLNWTWQHWNCSGRIIPYPTVLNIHRQPHNKVTQKPLKTSSTVRHPAGSHESQGPAFSHRIGNPTTSSLELGSGVLAGECFSCTLLISMTEEALASLSSATLGMEAFTSPMTGHDWVDFERYS